MRVFITSKSAAEQYVGDKEKALTFVINLQIGESAILTVPVLKKDFDKYEVGKYYDIA